MTEAASLRIDVDSNDVKNATQALRELADAADRAHAAIERLKGRGIVVSSIGGVRVTPNTVG